MAKKPVSTGTDFYFLKPRRSRLTLLRSRWIFPLQKRKVWPEIGELIMGVTNCDNANVCNSRFPLGFFLLFRGDTVSLVVAISPAGVPNGPSGSDFLIPMCIRRRGWLKARRGEKEEDLIIKETSVKCLTFFLWPQHRQCGS